MVLIPGLISLILFGLKPSIDFTGGSLLEIKFLDEEQSANYQANTLENGLQDLYQIETIQETAQNSLILRGKEISNEGTQRFRFIAAVTPADEPGRLVWDIGRPGVSIQFEANGTLTFIER